MFYYRQLHVSVLLIVSAAAVVSVCIDAVRMRVCYGGRLYLFRVVHAAVTHLDVVLVEDFPEVVVFENVLIN